MDWSTYLIYGAPLLLVLLWFSRKRRRLERASAEASHIAHEAGLLDPASMHPVVDPAKCIGCGSCIKACPEQPHHHVLGLIDGRAQLVSPTDCIGHGACKIVCPVEAITLVFGTERRGVDIPVVTPSFETTVPGIFIAGELGGMGLIRNALEQGRQAVEALHDMRHKGKKRNGSDYDLVIVGAGPAGFSGSLTAMSKDMRFLTLEQESLGGCVFQYPRGKLVMTSPAQLPLVGQVNFRNTSKEELLKFWQSVEKKTQLKVNYYERVESVEQKNGGFVVHTTKGHYSTHSVLLSIGRRGTPRKLGVPGEELPKVVYRLLDPEQYAGKEVVVVGGGDSAMEAAASIAELGSAKVILSYRGDAFGRAKPRNRERVAAAQKTGTLGVMLNSTLKEIKPESVVIDQKGKMFEVTNDAVIVNAGGILPTEFLNKAGIKVETKFGTI